ncbi:hypothetical protein STENM223S_11548 [Streptomyces tendae]
MSPVRETNSRTAGRKSGSSSPVNSRPCARYSSLKRTRDIPRLRVSPSVHQLRYRLCRFLKSKTST